ncbi:MAG: signal peptidase I [Candidatus Saccharibacteria bacterium]|nr:signal peptidase I [Candidatus Saccharibacteria bacterium]
MKAIVIFTLLWLSFGAFVGFRRVTDVSMDGRINDGDFILFNRMGKNHNVGDVVIYSYDGRELMSEIIGEEDDLITLNDDGYLLVNGVIVSNAPVYDSTLDEANPFGDGFRVPMGGYFVLNSNYEDVNDSRSFGAIRKSDIKGSVIALLLRTWSF